MRRTFLRAPDGPVGVAADAVRILAALAIPVAWILWSPLAAATAALGAFGALVPRALAVRPWFDLAFGVVVVTSAWCSVLDLYLTAPWIDVPIHFLLNGMLAALAFLVLVEFDVIPETEDLRHPVATAVVVTVGLGCVLGIVWELAEWAGHTFVDDTILVGYQDTLGDLTIGALGAAVAGLLVTSAVSRRSAVPA